MKTALLEEIESYRHWPVIERFKKDFPHRAEEAESLFVDLMRFFWLSQKHSEDRKENPGTPELDFISIMDEEMREIDQMWHVFLLYTKDYMDFCQRYFGEYLHHLPDIVDGLPQDPQQFETNLEKFLSYSYDLLGEDVVRRWFGEELSA